LFSEDTIKTTTEGCLKMKKILLVAAFVLTSFVVVNAKDTYDFLNSDGSAYRISVDKDWCGRTTIDSSYVSRDQRGNEELAAAIVKALVWLIKG